MQIEAPSKWPLFYAVIILTNEARTHFVVQRKDASYKVPRALALFGGAIEAGETPGDTMLRELGEELGPVNLSLLAAYGQPRYVGVCDVFALFDLVVSDAVLETIAHCPIYEGERAEIIHRADLPTYGRWLDRHLPMLHAYLTLAPDFVAHG